MLFEFQESRQASITNRAILRETMDDAFIIEFKDYITEVSDKITTSALYKPARFKYNIEKYNCNPMFSPILLQSRISVDDKRQLVDCLRN